MNHRKCVLTTDGADYHVFTHAFFKAVLFLACGAIMQRCAWTKAAAGR